jgi:hypothetical protein
MEACSNLNVLRVFLKKKLRKSHLHFCRFLIAVSWVRGDVEGGVDGGGIHKEDIAR